MSNIFKYLILPIVLFFSALALVLWVLLPMYNDIGAATEVKKQNEDNLKDRIELSANLERLVNQYNERLTGIESFSKVIPEGQNIPELLVGLEDMASGSGLAFASVNFKTKDLKVPGFKTLVMEIKVKGSYPNFKNYLQNLEKSLRIFDVMSVSFSGIGPGQIGANLNNLEFNLLVNTYYQ